MGEKLAAEVWIEKGAQLALQHTQNEWVKVAADLNNKLSPISAYVKPTTPDEWRKRKGLVDELEKVKAQALQSLDYIIDILKQPTPPNQ